MTLTQNDPTKMNPELDYIQVVMESKVLYHFADGSKLTTVKLTDKNNPEKTIELHQSKFPYIGEYKDMWVESGRINKRLIGDKETRPVWFANIYKRNLAGVSYMVHRIEHIVMSECFRMIFHYFMESEKPKEKLGLWETATEITCPECKNKKLILEHGDIQTMEQPPTPDVLYCPECGYDTIDIPSELYGDL